MSTSDFLIACVGKPSAGKSSFLNAVTDATAKVGNYPFTTIKPNHGVAYYPTACPCKRFGKTDQCRPRYGRCMDGTRYVPVRMLDVAGLVPGASEGLGLGNQFLDDLRTADVLMHVVDASGTTDANGKATKGYDPSRDIEWLRQEIHSWIFNNLWKRWPGIVRRHLATKSTSIETLHAQFSGYGTPQTVVARFMDRMALAEPLDAWDEATVHQVVDHFLDERFPTIIVLNKIDLPDADLNVAKIMKKYGEDKVVLTSALGECFLRKMHKAGYIRYREGTDEYDTKDELVCIIFRVGLCSLCDGVHLTDHTRVDLVLYRYGSTGVQEAVQHAVDQLHVIPAYPVRNINNFTSGEPSRQSGVFRDCILVRPNTTVRQFARLVHPDIERHYGHAETVGGLQLGESDTVSTSNNIITFKTVQGTGTGTNATN
ncbi:P-loop containing nucleoside triphosphate hydrolase protein [Thamnocephalis sphaerospora]|uniref:P-loop containing nucleoside triphosphate hydrolase protein n=1 Tax=Thamnocephalis sphaerospora TaxID=78915 RepID=A0A4V1IWF8_9FUNG|nr:P-loop containing nucleoside triphosphate hydrolase protein [Thamnocephalis sphaerospora]|eukprot:RKP07409.1 P-loop containing nucleoside triphosphate hydrolase protein [Thamnocephalis sphaerospora]